MKRSHINNIIENALEFFSEMNFKLPPFATFSIDDWQKNKSQSCEIFDLKLGWDVTDFGMGLFEDKGLLLFTLRNGILKSNKYPKPFAEKIMVVKENQLTPLHYHINKMEDIINRGGGDLAFQFYLAISQRELSQSDVEIVCDGIKKTVKAGEVVKLRPGESVSLPPYLHHCFWGVNGKVLVGEVSMVNDDETDNYFYEPLGRFPAIEEDEPPNYLLCTDYDTFLS
jgi:D-lyxose ketol-isomerase